MIIPRKGWILIFIEGDRDEYLIWQGILAGILLGLGIRAGNGKISIDCPRSSGG